MISKYLKLKTTLITLAPVLLAGSMVICGCSKNWTNSQDALVGQPDVESFWANADADAASRATVALYTNLRAWNNTGFAMAAIEGLGSDDEEKGSVPNDAAYMNMYDNFTADPTEGQGASFWQGQYQNINFCNQVIDNVPNITMDESLKARYLGEAKFIRALSYFRLVRAFGNIPLVLKLPVTAAELNPVQAAPADVWAAIEKDLDDAADVLPVSYDAANVGRATKGAALALHAKVALYQQKWADVVNFTNQVTGLGVYSLFPDFYSMFRIANENNSESIFEIQCNYVSGNSSLSNSQYSQIRANRDAGAGWGFDVPTQSLVDAFEPGDPRLGATIMFAGTTTPSGDAVPEPQAGAPSMYNMKSYVPFALALTTNQGADQNVRMIRYADVLLMNAEANAELENSADALASLEKVRARARALSSDPANTLPEVTTTDKDELIAAILHERRVELALENDRYFDLIRTGNAATVLGPKGWKAGKNEYWAIPQTEIDNSGGTLKQNPGY